MKKTELIKIIKEELKTVSENRAVEQHAALNRIKNEIGQSFQDSGQSEALLSLVGILKSVITDITTGQYQK